CFRLSVQYWRLESDTCHKQGMAQRVWGVGTLFLRTEFHLQNIRQTTFNFWFGQILPEVTYNLGC
ncbi:hypothetical protein, partial [Nostoc sp. CCY 9925]|uniref:hypothetical protein n=1 Tax=Nostoc sp. CCY 9925 TaxID=3103865 RepID=UPI0039C683E3